MWHFACRYTADKYFKEDSDSQESKGEAVSDEDPDWQKTLSGQLNSSKLNIENWTKLLNNNIIEQEAIEQLYDWTKHN